MHYLLSGTLLVLILNAQACREQAAMGTQQTPQDTEQNGTVQDPEITQQETVRMPVITDKRWYLLTMNDTEIADPEGGERPWLEMSEDRMQGFSGCNNMMGTVSIENDRILFTEMGSTKKYCPELQQLERQILDMLAEVNTFSMEEGALTFWEGNRELASFRTAD